MTKRQPRPRRGRLPRALLRGLLGRRLPLTDGRLTVVGPEAPLRIRRDRFGIPYLAAGSERDAWFGLGFCQGQDRGFQIELLCRTANGTLAELVGRSGLAIDRFARRVGFRRAAVDHLTQLPPEQRDRLDAFARGLTLGSTSGQPRRSHEFALLLARPRPIESLDLLALLKLQALFVAANWDLELARLILLAQDGLAALHALDPTLRAADGAAQAAAPWADCAARLFEEAAALRRRLPGGLASNAWVLSGGRTASGRPLLSNDPHLPPQLPSHWYLAHLRTPDWAVSGATFVGLPAFLAGHNGRAAWGVTAGLADTVDLFLESSPGGSDDSTTTVEEPIAVRAGRRRVETVRLTPRGPLVGPALHGGPAGISMAATFLAPHALDGCFGLHRVASFDDLRALFASESAFSLVVYYADANGRIGRQLVGRPPRRRGGGGALPRPVEANERPWDGLVPFAALPFAVDPPDGILVGANEPPAAAPLDPDLGCDWLDHYRHDRLHEILAARRDWRSGDARAVHLDVLSLPWRALRASVLALSPRAPDARRALALLSDWDGEMAADSPAAAVFELVLAGLGARLARLHAPRAWRWALGAGPGPLTPHSLFAVRQVGRLVEQIRTQPSAGAAPNWPALLEQALAEAVETLRRRAGEDSARWAWGSLRPITYRHVFAGRIPFLRAAFDRGPFACAGDANSVAQASPPPDDPLGDPLYAPSLRMVVEVGDWDHARFGLPGGQSGNPLSPHYDDLLALWREGELAVVPFTEAAVAAAGVTTLELVPEEEASD